MNAKMVCFLLLFSSLTLTAGALQEPSQEGRSEPELVVPEGTNIPIIVQNYLKTSTSQVGDTLYADTNYPIWIQQRLVIPRGSIVRGTITEIEKPGRIKGRGRMAIRFDDILLPNGVKREFVATFRGIHGEGDETVDRKSETVKAPGSKGEDAGTVVGTTAEGAILGTIIGGGNNRGTGAAIGAGAGAAAGIATLLFTRGRDLVLSPGTQFDLELMKPLKFAYNEVEFSQAELNSAPRAVQPRTVAPARSPATRIPFPGIGFPRIPY